MSCTTFTFFGRMEAILWRHFLNLRTELGPGQYSTVAIYLLYRIPESNLLFVVGRMKQAT